MKPRTCIICGEEKNNLFSFPKNEDSRKKWADAVGIRVDSIKDSMHKVCRKHFSTNQFLYNSRKKLKVDAIPSLHVVCFNDDEQSDSCDASHENESCSKRKDMCLLCGYVLASSFYRFPKNHLLRKQWAEFCGILIDDIKHFHRLCNRHFSDNHDKDKIPTLYPREKCDEDKTVASDSAVGPFPERIEQNLQDLRSASESENIMIVSENTENTDAAHFDSSSSGTPQPLIYFKRYGDIKESDVVTPRRAVLSLKMGKAELDKCRKQLKIVQKENYRLRIKVKSLDKQLKEMQEKQLLSQYAVQNILVNRSFITSP